MAKRRAVRELAVDCTAGTPGYADPLYSRTGVVTEANEVYSFGMTVIELLIGLPPALLAADGTCAFVHEHLRLGEAGAKDRLLGRLDVRAEWPLPIATRLAVCSLLCINDDLVKRPSFLDVATLLMELAKDASMDVTPCADPAPGGKPNEKDEDIREAVVEDAEDTGAESVKEDPPEEEDTEEEAPMSAEACSEAEQKEEVHQQDPRPQKQEAAAASVPLAAEAAGRPVWPMSLRGAGTPPRAVATAATGHGPRVSVDSARRTLSAPRHAHKEERHASPHVGGERSPQMSLAAWCSAKSEAQRGAPPSAKLERCVAEVPVLVQPIFVAEAAAAARVAEPSPQRQAWPSPQRPARPPPLDDLVAQRKRDSASLSPRFKVVEDAERTSRLIELPRPGLTLSKADVLEASPVRYVSFRRAAHQVQTGGTSISVGAPATAAPPQQPHAYVSYHGSVSAPASRQPVAAQYGASPPHALLHAACQSNGQSSLIGPSAASANAPCTHVPCVNVPCGATSAVPQPPHAPQVQNRSVPGRLGVLHPPYASHVGQTNTNALCTVAAGHVSLPMPPAGLGFAQPQQQAVRMSEGVQPPAMDFRSSQASRPPAVAGSGSPLPIRGASCPGARVGISSPASGHRPPLTVGGVLR